MKLAFVIGLVSSLFLVSGYKLMSDLDQERKYIDFDLNHGQQSWTFSKNSRDLNIIYFGYTLCPDLCPMTSSYMAKVVKRIPLDQQDKTQFIFINVDTRMENPAEVAQYVRQFNKDFVGLSGSKDKIDKTIKKVGGAYLIEDKPKTTLGYTVAHPDKLFIIDRSGLILGSIAGPKSAQHITNKLKEFL